MNPRRWGLAVYLAGLLGVLSGYSLAPRLASSLAGSVAVYYTVYLAVEAVLAVAIVYFALKTRPERRAEDGGVGASPVRLALALASMAAVFLGFTAILGPMRTPIAGPRGALLASLLYLLVAAPGAAAAEGAARLGGPLSSLAGAVLGLILLNPAHYVGLGGGLSPSEFMGLAVYAFVGVALGLTMVEAALNGGVAASGLIAAAYLILALGLPYTVGMGAVGFALASLAAIYAGYMVLSWAPVEVEEESPAIGLSRGAKAFIAALAVVATIVAGLAVSGVMFWRPVVIVTGSMTGTLNPGDLVILKEPRNVSVGDIVTYQYHGVAVTHRVVEEEGQGLYRTKGDANAEEDPYMVEENDILGTVWARIPGAGWPVILVNWNNTTRLATIALTLAALAAVLKRK